MGNPERPPRVTIIDEKRQEFCGTIYLKDHNGYYARGLKKIHRDVWAYFNGEIPDGYVVHHIDENKANNNIENLQCMTGAEHRQLHNSSKTVAICEVCGKPFEARKAAPRSTCSKKCYDQKYRARMKTVICPVCGKKFETKINQPAQTCSQSCSALLRWRRFVRIAPKTETRICVICGKPFETSRSHHIQTCSRSCGYKLGRQRHSREDTAQTVTRICVICGKPFETLNRRPAKTCSKSCAVKLGRQSLNSLPITETRICVVCGKDFEILKRKSTKTCSRHCTAVLREQTKRNQPEVANSVDSNDTSNCNTNSIC